MITYSRARIDDCGNWSFIKSIDQSKEIEPFSNGDLRFGWRPLMPSTRLGSIKWIDKIASIIYIELYGWKTAPIIIKYGQINVRQCIHYTGNSLRYASPVCSVYRHRSFFLRALCADFFPVWHNIQKIHDHHDCIERIRIELKKPVHVSSITYGGDLRVT